MTEYKEWELIFSNLTYFLFSFWLLFWLVTANAFTAIMLLVFLGEIFRENR